MNEKKSINDDELLILDYYYLKIKYYNQKLEILNKHKPFVFEFNKLKEYKKEISEIENNIKLYEEKIANIINDNY